MDNDHNKFLQMQDEMSRFEAEISGGETLPAPPPPRCIIGSNTYGTIQSRLEAPLAPVSAVPLAMNGGILPPPPPPMMPMMSSYDDNMGSYDDSMGSYDNNMGSYDNNMGSYDNNMGSYDGNMGPMMPIGPNQMIFNNITPPPPPPMLIPHQVQRARLAPPMHQQSMSPVTMFSSPFMRNVQLEAPPKPQPVVLSGAPQLYNKPKLAEATEKKKDLESLPQPIVTPKPPKAEYEPPSEQQTFNPKDTDSSSQQTVAKGNKKEKKNRKLIRTAGGTVWEDTTLADWGDEDFRLFCGDLGNDVTDELLMRTFSKYASFQKAKVVRDKRTNKSKGFGFVSFKDPADFIKAMKEMNGRYVGSRPIKLRKSTWRNRSLDVVRKKEKEKAALIAMFTGGKKN